MSTTTPPPSLDALPPADIARRTADVGVTKAGLHVAPLFALGVLAGAFIAMGAAFSNTVLAGEGMPYGAGRLLGGLAFSTGLVLVALAGAELFTGDVLMTVAWASGRVATRRLLRTWVVVYAGNMLGAGLTAVLVFLSGIHQNGHDAVGRQALATAAAKTDLSFGRAVVLGILCNALVCLAVWMAFGAHSTADRVLAIVPPIAAFVAMGFEHCVANMYLIPYGLLLQADDGWVAGLESPPDTSSLDVGSYLWGNLVPVTIGNIVGGALLVAVVYWSVYLRESGGAPSASRPDATAPDGAP
jgi:formate/nitrite transporter